MSLAERIRERLGVIDMTQAELCRRASIPPSTLNSILQRDSRTSPHLGKLAAALRTTPSWLLGDTDDPESPVGSTAISFEERELIELTRTLEREDYNVVSYLIRRLASGGKPALRGAVNDATAPTLHDRQLGYRSG